MQLELVRASLQEKNERISELEADHQKLMVALDPAQSRTEHAEQGKSGMSEMNSVLATMISKMKGELDLVNAAVERCRRYMNLDLSVLSPELAQLDRYPDNSLQSSEQSQPAPTQDNFCAHTQPDDDDFEPTQDQEGAANNAEPFTSEQSIIPLDPSMAEQFAELEQHQPFSTDLSGDDTQGEGKFSLSESTQSSSSSSKTPPAPPLHKSKIAPPPLARMHADEETKGEEADAEKVDKTAGEESDAEEVSKVAGEEANAEEASKSGRDDSDGDKTSKATGEESEEEHKEEEGETALQEEDEDKENTPLKAPDTSSGSDKAKASQSGQPGWLQTIVTNEEKGEQNSASEGGIFDDETQLSEGE